MTAGEWGSALAEYERVLAAGKDLRAEVSLHYKNAGVVALAQGHRDLALDHFLCARALGLDDAGLGTERGSSRTRRPADSRPPSPPSPRRAPGERGNWSRKRSASEP